MRPQLIRDLCRPHLPRLIAVFGLVGAVILTGARSARAGGSHLDYSFIPNGKVITDFGGGDGATAVAIQSDGKIVVAGTSSINGGDFAVARYNANGLLDTSFNGDGKVTTDFFGNNDGANAVVIQSDGKIVAVGVAYAEGRLNFGVVRYNTNGSLDTTFSGNGKFYFGFNDNGDIAYSVALQSDGKIVIAGEAAADWGVARLNTDGSLDSTFGTNGKITTSFGGSNAGSPGAKGVVVQSNGKLVAGGGARLSGSGNDDFALARYNSNGSLDTTFGNGGVVVTDIGGGFNDWVNALKLMSDGRLVLVGFTYPFPTTYTIAVVRYTSNGSLDTSFGTGGKYVGGDGFATDAVVQPGGDIFISDYISSSGNYTFDVLKLTFNGTPDPSFGTGGRVRTLTAMSAGAYGIALQSNGKIVAAGTYNGNFLTVRYNPISTAANSDFSRDGHADFAVFRPATGTWYVSNSVNGAFGAVQFGANGDLPVPGDYDGDGATDAAVFRPSNSSWYILQSSNSTFRAAQFGTNGDLRAQGDYDGDSKTDIAVYRPSTTTWYIQRSTLGFEGVAFGAASDNPVPADYDGDGLTDIAVFRPSSGTWYEQRSSQGFYGIQFGQNLDRPVPADYDADGKADIGVFRPSNGSWYVLKSGNNAFTAAQWGAAGDIAAPADYDGDGKADYAVWRPSTGIWYALRSSNAQLMAVPFGASGDVPIASSYVP